jgi:hypothetical protein
MRIHSLRTFAFVLLLAAGRIAAQGQSILEQLPADATGFMAVHNLAAASEKIERITTLFKELTSEPLPAPLAIAMSATGVGPGLNQQGNALLALLPSDDAPLTPQPLLLIPVSDYAAFAESIGGDATGEICRVMIAEEEVLLAQRGDFAALMNVEHREQLEKVLAATPAMPADLAPLSEWLASTDVAIGITRSGVERFTALARRQAADGRQQAAAAGNSPELRELQQTMQQLDQMVQFLGAEMQAGAVGLTIDDATNVRLAKRVLLSQAGVLASLAEAQPLPKSPLANFSSGPFVIAGGGPLPPGFGDAFARLTRRFVEQLPAGQGYEGLKPNDWEKLEQSYRDSVAGLTSAAFVLRPGEKEEGLLSNYFFASKSSGSQQYLESFRKSLQLQNEVMEAAENDLSLPYEISSVNVADKPAVLGVADVAAAAADPNVPGVDPLMKTIFGPDGKMRIYAVAADAETAVIGSAAEEKLAKAVTFALNGEDSLAGEWTVDATTKLLDPKAPWIALVSPQGLVAWISRGVQTWAATFGGDIKIPPFPATAPIGFSFNLASGQFHSEVVVTEETLNDIAEYVSQFPGF